jgi:DNA-binding winged helix-turn-helix (wHTH) protein
MGLALGDFSRDREPSQAAGHLYRFAQFVLDSRKRTLSRADSPVSLTPKAFDVLLFLVQNPNRLVTKEELLRAVWADTFVEEGNLTQYISHLRKALGDNSEDTRLIVTIARKGYQFTERVTVSEEVDAAQYARLPAATETSKTDARPMESPTVESVTKPPSPHSQTRKWFAAAGLLTVVAAASWLCLGYRRLVTLSATDTIVLADVRNETSDSVFDDALNTALRYGMEQTPYLNILGIDKVSGTLAQLNLPPTTKLTADVARQICGKTNSKMVISQSIGDAGNGYHLQMRALDCGSGAVLAKEQADIRERNEVVHELGVTAARLRAKLGEPTDSLERFNQPLEEALSASLDALQTDAQGHKLHLAGDAEGALKLYQRAVELDPNLAVTHEAIGSAEGSLGHHELMIAAFARAYQLRERVTEKNRLNIELIYCSNVTGELDKAYSISLRALELYPRDVFFHRNLANTLIQLGQLDRAAAAEDEMARLGPSPIHFAFAAQDDIVASRFKEARSWLAQAEALKFDNLGLRTQRLRLAFIEGDRSTFDRIFDDEVHGPNRVVFLRERSRFEGQQGHFDSSDRLQVQASKLSSDPEDISTGLVFSALQSAEAGRAIQARKIQNLALQSKLERNRKMVLALSFARSGRTDEANQFADEVSQEAPLDTIVQKYLVPTVRAAVKLQQHDPAAAIELLRGTIRYDLADTQSFDYLYPAYIRGLAYLESGDGRSAAGEFQKLVDNPGLCLESINGPLAQFQLARAQKMIGDEAAARKSYETFLDLWKSADPDNPIYQQAKSEYAKLRK